MRTREKPVTVSKRAKADRIHSSAAYMPKAIEKAGMRFRAVLLDRDGVINSLVYHQEAGVIDSPFRRAQFHLLPRVPEAIHLLNVLGLRVAIVSNQPGIAKGHLKPETLEWFDRKLIAAVQAAGGHIDGIFYCLHHPDAVVPSLRRRCHCRKPRTGLLTRAAEELGVPISECYMVGDGIPDLLAGTRAGCRTIFIGRWKCEICHVAPTPKPLPDLMATDLWEACQLIRAETPPHSAEMPLRRTECLEPP